MSKEKKLNKLQTKFVKKVRKLYPNKDIVVGIKTKDRK